MYLSWTQTGSVALEALLHVVLFSKQHFKGFSVSALSLRIYPHSFIVIDDFTQG